MLRPILGKPVRDPTSGFVGVNRTALALFSRSFPLEYPEIEALVVLQRKRFRFVEVPCVMRPRRTGRSTITALRRFITLFMCYWRVCQCAEVRRPEKIRYDDYSTS